MTYSLLAQVLSEERRTDEAIAALQTALRLQPDSSRLHIMLGNTFLGARRFDEAEAAMRKAIEIDAKLSNCYGHLANVLLKRGNRKEAAEAWRKAIELNPNNFADRMTLVSVLRQLGKNDDADEILHKAIAEVPTEAGPLNAIAWYLATASTPDDRDPQRAVEFAKRATQLAATDGACWNTLGVAQYRASDFDGAILSLTRSLELRKGGDAFDWFFLAMVHFKRDAKTEAMAYYNKAAQWMDKNAPKQWELTRFRAEAAELLSIKEQMPESTSAPSSQPIDKTNDSTTTSSPTTNN
jgi:superkiller protein 3